MSSVVPSPSTAREHGANVASVVRPVAFLSLGRGGAGCLARVAGAGAGLMHGRLLSPDGHGP